MDESHSTSDLAANAPNASLMYSTYTPTFGNLNFVIQPSMTGEVNDTFGVVPYMSLESLVYMQQVQAATNSANQTGGQITGQQNVTGAITVTDSANNVRVAIGSQSSASGSF